MPLRYTSLFDAKHSLHAIPIHHCGRLLAQPSTCHSNISALDYKHSHLQCRILHNTKYSRILHNTLKYSIILQAQQSTCHSIYMPFRYARSIAIYMLFLDTGAFYYKRSHLHDAGAFDSKHSHPFRYTSAFDYKHSHISVHAILI